MEGPFLVEEFRYSERSGSELTVGSSKKWESIDPLTLSFYDTDEGTYLVTFTAPDTWNTEAAGGTQFRIVVWSRGPSEPEQIAWGLYKNAAANIHTPFSLVGIAKIHPNRAGMQIIVQWKTWHSGVSHIGSTGTTSVSAIGKNLHSR
ncbi:MAG: hypothetical protein E4H08_08925 [Candidatus Atribacteria bacterium]|nr:MAG: hypothetical protein E4H08_08925 [Candidatus Atribacteria bacterium]